MSEEQNSFLKEFARAAVAVAASIAAATLSAALNNKAADHQREASPQIIVLVVPDRQDRQAVQPSFTITAPTPV